MIQDVDYYIALVESRIMTKEAVTRNGDGTYTIFVSSYWTTEQQQKSAEHAVFHIEKGQFDDENVQEIETIAHADRREELSNLTPAQIKELYGIDWEDRIKSIQRRRKKTQKKLKFMAERQEFMRENGLRKSLFNI